MMLNKSDLNMSKQAELLRRSRLARFTAPLKRKSSIRIDVQRLFFACLSLMLVFSGLSGCLNGAGDEEGLQLAVNYDQTSGTILHQYEDGELVHVENVVLTFDFEGTTSAKTLETFGVNRLDGRPGTTVDASISNEVSVEFTEHGLHELALFASDSVEQRIVLITVRIEWRIEWTEISTSEPMPMELDTSPLNNGTPPSVLVIESTVHNPALVANIGGGQEVDVTWALIDEADQACQSQPGTIQDGESSTWNTVHFNTNEVHQLQITYEEGQDAIDVQQTIDVQYETLETPPNA